MSPRPGRPSAAQLALARQVRNLEWAARMFRESAVPQSVDVDRLLREIGEAVREAQHEAMVRVRAADAVRAVLSRWDEP